MSCFYAIFSNATRGIQSDLKLHIPEIPKDAVNGVIRSFACSFTVSALVSGGNPVAGLSGGALAILATAVHIAFMTGIKSLQAQLHHRFRKPIEPISFANRHCVFLLSWGGMLYLGDALGLAINNKASFFATIPLILANNTLASAKTPIMGMIVM